MRNVEAPATALVSTVLAHDTVEPALDAASQRKVGAVDCQDQAAIEHTRIEPVGQDELDANGSATVVESSSISALTTSVGVEFVQHQELQAFAVIHHPAIHLVEARVLGSGAGMEAPAGSRFERGVWHYDPHVAPLQVLRLTHSIYTAGYEICHDGACQALAESAPRATNGDVIALSACPAGR